MLKATPCLFPVPDESLMEDWTIILLTSLPTGGIRLNCWAARESSKEPAAAAQQMTITVPKIRIRIITGRGPSPWRKGKSEKLCFPQISLSIFHADCADLRRSGEIIIPYFLIVFPAQIVNYY